MSCAGAPYEGTLVSAKPEAPEGAEPPKSKKKLIMIIAVVALALAGGGGWFMMSKKKSEDAEEEVAHAPAKTGPPTYLAVEMMVVNLADPGGEKVAQVGVTLELTDAKVTEKVKPYLPSIKNSILMLVSQRTAEELLQREGKEKLAEDIFKEASRPFVGDEEPEDKPKKDSKSKKKKPKKPPVDNPIVGVLFSSFIVQ